MCSILTNIIRKDLTNIIREYLLPAKNNIKDILQIEYFHLPNNEFLDNVIFSS